MNKNDVEKEVFDIIKRAAVTFPLEEINKRANDSDYWLNLLVMQIENKGRIIILPFVPDKEILKVNERGHYCLLSDEEMGGKKDLNHMMIADWNIAKAVRLAKLSNDETYFSEGYLESEIALSEFTKMLAIISKNVKIELLKDIIDDTTRDTRIIYLKFKNIDGINWENIKNEFIASSLFPDLSSISEKNKFITVVYSNYWKEFIKLLNKYDGNLSYKGICSILAKNMNIDEKDLLEVISEEKDKEIPSHTNIDLDRIIALNNFLTLAKFISIEQLPYAIDKKGGFISFRTIPNIRKGEVNSTVEYYKKNLSIRPNEYIFTEGNNLIYTKFILSYWYNKLYDLIPDMIEEYSSNLLITQNRREVSIIEVLKEAGFFLEDEISDNLDEILLKLKQKLLEYSEGEEMEEKEMSNVIPTDVESNVQNVSENINEVQFNHSTGIRFEVDLEKLMADADKINPAFLENPDLLIPSRGTPGSAGYDVLYPYKKGITIWHNTQEIIESYIKVYMPSDVVCKMHLRSSVGTKRKLRLGNQTGVIDSDYTMDTIKIPMSNISGQAVDIMPDEYIVQLLFERIILADNDKVRNPKRVGGIGSTGRLRS